MKKLSVLLIAIMSCLSLFAELASDIIVTVDKETYSVNVVLVGTSEIQYKKVDFPDGPLYAIPISKVSAIMYKNGTIEQFNSVKQETPKEENMYLNEIEDRKGRVTLTAYFDNFYNGEYVSHTDTSITIRNDFGQEKTYFAKSLKQVNFRETNAILKVKDNKFYESNPKAYNNANLSQNISRDGQTYIFGNQRMRGKEYANFLNQHCPQAYQTYTAGRQLSSAGWGLFACGVCMDLGVSIYCLSKGRVDRVGYALSAVAGGFEVSSIVMLAVGYSKMHKSAKIYNSTCSKTTYWSINAGQNGLGFACHF